jgi:ferric-dicitrate binding protein FerR (iron transport regulator)
MSDYLWDKQGEPDAELEHLEQLLAPLAHRPIVFLPPAPARLRRSWVVALSAVAAIAIALLILRPRPRLPEQAGLALSVHGAGAKLGDRAVNGESKLPTGAWLDTGESKVTLTVGSIGSVEIAAQSRLRIVESSAQAQVLELDHGALIARITAPPRSFTVKTKHATAIDLGCAFELRSDLAGEGRLIVTQGRVALADEHGSEVAVAAGAECGISDSGPGVPFSSDASPAFREAMLRYPHDHQALAKIVEQARAQDRDVLTRMSSLLDAADRLTLEQRVVELSRGDAVKAPELTPKPLLKTPTAPHSSKVEPHKHPTQSASAVVPTASSVKPTAQHVGPSTPAQRKPPTSASPSREKLNHDPFGSNNNGL